jgi:pheromone shutdown protein TraB
VVLAKCIEALHSSAHIVAAECAAWGKEADKLSARVEQEMQAAADAAASQQAKVAQLDADIAAARKRVALLTAARA